MSLEQDSLNCPNELPRTVQVGSLLLKYKLTYNVLVNEICKVTI